MLCIASFIVFLILGVFSGYYRALAKKAWQCVGRRITFRPCDTSFADDVKGKLFGKMMFTHPRQARFLEKWVDFFALIFVVVSIWSLVSVALTGLNLWVYDTCNPANPESCSLSGEACAIAPTSLTFSDAIASGKVVEYITAPFITFGETVSRVPDRLKNWSAEDYLIPSSTYYLPFDASKSTALEVIDPSCLFCKKLFGNIKTAGFESLYNLTYIVYPIPNPDAPGQYKFPHSYLLASYLEALKSFPLENTQTSADWLLLEKIFTAVEPGGGDLQAKFATIYSEDEARKRISELLSELGYSDAEILLIDEKVLSSEVKDSLQKQREVVEQEIKTLKIPTIMFDGRRYDRVVAPEKLK